MRDSYDVIIVGAGPGGSSAASFLAEQGISTLVLDKAQFPREKVCGDGLIPQAIYWLDRLGCAEEVLAEADCCITSGDVYINGQLAATCRFPQNGPYPAFGTILDRKRLDHILLKNALSKGAHFEPGCKVTNLTTASGGTTVTATRSNKSVQFKGKIVIGADGANSIVSRLIGNKPKDEDASAVAVRGYFEGVKTDRSNIMIYFDERFFPGYGWVFVDDHGKANIGIGYSRDKNFRPTVKIRDLYQEFVTKDLGALLKGAKEIGSPGAGWVSYCRPERMTADGVLLIGDAASLADPSNGGGIHRAMESACFAAEVVQEALACGDFSQNFLLRYESLLKRTETDRLMGEFVFSFAQNPHLRELYMFFMGSASRLIKDNPQLEEFCMDFMCGTSVARNYLNPLALASAVPVHWSGWLADLLAADENGLPSGINGFFSLLSLAGMSVGRMIQNPAENVRWGAGMMSQAIDIGRSIAETADSPMKGPEGLFRLSTNR